MRFVLLCTVAEEVQLREETQLLQQVQLLEEPLENGETPEKVQLLEEPLENRETPEKVQVLEEPLEKPETPLSEARLLEMIAIQEQELLAEISEPEPQLVLSSDEEDAVEEAVVCDGNCDTPQEWEIKIDEHFQRMETGSEPPRKRRRLRGKVCDPRTPIPFVPTKKLGHYASERGLSPMVFRLMLLCGLPMALINAFVFLEGAAPLGGK